MTRHRYPVVEDIGLVVHNTFETSFKYFGKTWVFDVRSKSEENIAKSCLTYYKEFWEGNVADPIGKTDIVVDVGAHVGFFSIPIAHMAGVLLAFEPAPANFELLQRNAFKNKTIFNTFPDAIGPTDEEVTLNLGVRGTTGHTISGKKLGGVSTQVKCHTLGTIVKLYNPTILKLDCEGAEWDILSNSEHLKGIRMIIAELHKVTEDKMKSLLAVMDASGMQYAIKQNSWFSKLTAWRE